MKARGRKRKIKMREKIFEMAFVLPSPQKALKECGKLFPFSSQRTEGVGSYIFEAIIGCAIINDSTLMASWSFKATKVTRTVISKMGGVYLHQWRCPRSRTHCRRRRAPQVPRPRAAGQQLPSASPSNAAMQCFPSSKLAWKLYTPYKWIYGN